MRLVSALGAAIVLSLFAGCTKSPVQAPGTAIPTSPGAAHRLELVSAEDRPQLGLVLREGDPRPALALAVSHDLGSDASLALAALVGARLRAAGFSEVETRAHGLGFVVSAFVTTPAEATRFVQSASLALRTPIAANEKPANTEKARAFRGRAEAAVGGCSGELGVTGAANPNPDAATLESWRRQIENAQSVAFAAVGPRTVLDATTAAVSGGASWPKAGGPADAWPAADAIGIDASNGRERRLSVAYRAGDPARALEAARALGAPGSVLATRIASLGGGWSLERVVATTRPRGACLRLDLKLPKGDPAPRALDLARGVALVDEESRASLAKKGDAWYLDEAVLRPSDPREAASVAAWRALVGRLAAGPTRRFVSYVGTPNEAGARAESELQNALSRVEASYGKNSIARKVRVESGQGELWALVASPCGTLSESSEDAGVTALYLRALAKARSGVLGVELEAWTTPDGAGLLAHSARLDASESSEAHARRIGEALGRALGASELPGSEIAEERSALLREIDRSGEKAWSLALDAVSGGHASWLEPRGSLGSLSGISGQSVEKTRHALVSGPLRLAVIANINDAQANEIARGLERWLRPQRLDLSACPNPGPVTARSGEIDVEVSESEPPRAFIAVPIRPDNNGIPLSAEWTLTLLNRKGGWLEQALASVPGGASARATVLGGTHAAALLVEVDALQAEPSTAVNEVRSLFDRLAKGAATAADVEIARRESRAKESKRSADPRRRAVELWTGTATQTADLAALRRLHQSFGPATHLLVYAHPRE